MILEKNVKAQKVFLNKHPGALTAEIDDFGNTIFHHIVQEPANTATLELLKELVLHPSVTVDTLKNVNVNGLSVVHVAASAGNKKALEVFAEKGESLLSINDQSNEGYWIPIHHAAFWRRKDTVEYLLKKTDPKAENFRPDLLLGLLIDSNLHGLALQILKIHPYLAEPDRNSCWISTVDKLAEKSTAYESGRKLGFWKRLIYSHIPVNDDDQDHVASPPVDNDIEMQNNSSTDVTANVAATIDIPADDDCQDHVALPPLDNEEIPIPQQIAATIGALAQKLCTLLWNILIQQVPFIKRIHDRKLMHLQTVKLVRTMISDPKVMWTFNKAMKNLKDPVLAAARLGIHEFVYEVLKAYPDSVLFYDEERHNIFLLAVLHRKENVFSLIHDQVASVRDHTNYVKDKHEHNILHLAGKMLAPPSQVPGAALQMQQELQWFMGIRDLFQPSLQEQHNADDLTPMELFTQTHKELVKKGERWMRDTATSCSVVGALIITIVFAAAFTVPGGLDPNGVPVFLNKTYFRIFTVSVALALFASTTSVQTFLGMLTSRYAEEDFLKALPKKMIVGLVTLFLSSISMMVAFGAAFCILLSHPWKWVIILICLLGCLPVTLFAWMQFPLLVDILIFTYGSGILKYCRPNPYQ